MYSKEKLDELLVSYLSDFDKYWPNEKYKWECVAHFQKNWDIEAENFAEMFLCATEKTKNLLTSVNYFPRGMIKGFAEREPETVRKMFKDLFDESNPDIGERINEFIRCADQLRDKYSEIGKMHYQRANSVTVYLWMRYPDKYFIYKFSELRAFANAIGNDFVPKKDGKIINVIKSYELLNDVSASLQSNEELWNKYKGLIDDNCYNDISGKILANDLAHYTYAYLGKQEGTDNTEITDPVAVVEDAATNSNCNYWWLTANPKIWSFSSINVGEEQSYTLYNENGNKRKVFQNFIDAKPGDVVICYEATPVKKVVALATISKANDGKSIYFEKKEEFVNPIAYSDLRDVPELQKMEVFSFVSGSLFKLTKDEYNVIMDIVRESNQTKTISDVSVYSKENFLSDVFMDETKYDDLVSVLKRKKNIVLKGAPGVGKTFAAKRLAYSVMGVKDESRVKFIQFHQNYSYEDFIMGYKPDANGFTLVDGVFLKFCKMASNSPEKDFFFIIDEINRGNMSKIFGELLMLIENEYRGEKATLAYNGMEFSVPKNLYIIGLMNTADRSLAMIDYALRRRFSFFEMEPGFATDGFKVYQKKLNNEMFDELIDMMEELNAAIRKDSSLGSGFCVGHSYFCNQVYCTQDWLKEIVNYDILPTLEEYWFDEPDKVQTWKNKFSGVLND